MRASGGESDWSSQRTSPRSRATRGRRDARFSLGLKLTYTGFVLVLIPNYVAHHGMANFLWFSDVVLLLLVIALWREDGLLFSMLSVGFLLPELAWVLDFVLALVIGKAPLRIAGYMFDPREHPALRALSGFHLVLPPLLLLGLHRLGYDRRAIWFQIPLTWTILLATYAWTDPSENINWVFGLGKQPQTQTPALIYLGWLMAFVAVVIHGATHWLLLRLFDPPDVAANRHMSCTL